ncbi:MAG TPA: response regulator [Gemmatimonadaceae bacterium]|jgi:PleD family two-component response regulator
MVDLQKTRLVLIASDGEWEGRSLESVFELNGYSVIRVERGRRALELARRTPLDALFLDAGLADMGGVEVCRALRDDPLFDHATPIVITSSVPAAHRVATAAFAAGAWEYCSQPIEVETLLLKLGTFIRARRALRDAEAGLLIDPSTGLFTSSGLVQWAKQLSARAVRKREPIACVAVMPQTMSDTRVWSSGEHASEEITNEILNHDALARVVDVCREEARRSDVIGYLGQSRLGILAPDTDAEGAQMFVGRLTRALEKAVPSEGRSKAFLHAGYCAIADLSAVDVEPTEMLRRAEIALDHAQVPLYEHVALNFDSITEP